MNYNAVDPKDAFNELIKRREKLHNFTANTNIEFINLDKSMKLKCIINRFGDSQAFIELNGPLGMSFASIELTGSDFIINRPQTGQVFRGSLNESVVIPELDIEVENMERLLELFVPVPYVKPDLSIVSAQYGNPGYLSLQNGSDSIALVLNYTPLSVLNEELWQERELIYSRQFFYDKDSRIFPSKIWMKIDDFELKIEYLNFKLRLNKNSSRSKINL